MIDGIQLEENTPFIIPDEDLQSFLSTYMNEYTMVDDNLIRQDSIFLASPEQSKRNLSINSCAETWLDDNFKGKQYSGETQPEASQLQQLSTSYPVRVQNFNSDSKGSNSQDSEKINIKYEAPEYQDDQLEIAQYFNSLDEELQVKQESTKRKSSGDSDRIQRLVQLIPQSISGEDNQINRGFSGTKSESPQKNDLLLEKNRRAQKRFRNKQKEKMHGLEVEVTELKEQLEGLFVENSNIRNQKDVLQYVVYNQEATCDIQKHTSRKALLASENKFIKQSQYKVQNDYGVQTSSSQKSCKDVFGKECCANRLSRMTYSEAKAIYTEWINIFRKNLQDSQDPSLKEHAQEVIVKERKNLAMFMCWLSLYNFQTTVRLFLYDLETSQQVQLNEEQDKQKIFKLMDAISATPKLWEQLANFYKLVQERKKDLYGLLQKQNTEFVQVNVDNMVKFYEVTNRFKEVAWQIHVQHTGCAGTVLFQIFSPEQTAKFLVESYPTFPNIAGLLYTASTLQPEFEKRTIQQAHNVVNSIKRNSLSIKKEVEAQ